MERDPDLPVGMDYHLADVIEVKKAPFREWQARCGCGWLGPVRVAKTAANEDAAAHDISANP